MNPAPRAQIYQGELQFISECLLEYPNLETGGDFFGFWSREGHPVVQYVLGPGDRTSRTSTSFFQDIDYLKECGGVLHSLFGLEHIGAWHSHHTLGLMNPSAGDVQTMRNALMNQHPSRFLISICNIEDRFSVSLGCFLFSRDSDADYCPCDVAVLPGESPVRDRLRKEGPRSPLVESRQRRMVEAISFKLRNTQGFHHESAREKPTKPHFADDSFWARREGQRYLKDVFDKLSRMGDLAPVDIKQLADGRPAISFGYRGAICEIRFPEDFPRQIPEVHLTPSSDEERYWNKRSRRSTSPHDIESVQQIINSLQMLEDDRRIVIRTD